MFLGTTILCTDLCNRLATLALRRAGLHTTRPPSPPPNFFETTSVLILPPDYPRETFPLFSIRLKPIHPLMEHQVFADIEIEDEKIDYYSSVIIRQQFNAHHEFAIRIKYDVLEQIGAFNLSKAQKKIGKLAIIKLVEAGSFEPAYEFRGLICEVGMEQSENFVSHLVLKGYSPTILLENGPHLASFYKKNLQQIVQQLTGPMTQSCRVNNSPQYKTTLTYTCQYRESAFHFLNRLSADFGEMCYYDGIDFFFGKPSSSPEIEVAYGADVHHLQLKLRILPLAFTNYAYLSKDDKFVSFDAPSSVDGLDEYAHFALQESNKVFTEPVSFPIRQRVESKSDLEGFVKKHKAAMAADLEVLSGSSDNPAICIGAIADVKAATRENNALAQESYGKFLITGIEHHLTENNKYYNNFEGIPAGVEHLAVKNIIEPIAEPQIANVMDNADPDNMGRVRVQMLWQQASNEMTDWLRVVAPNAGGEKNRGFVFIPEKDDQVLVCFRYNDPDRPFVSGSIFHGKTAAGGGSDNKSKTLTTRSGVAISIDDDKGSINVADAKGNAINFDGNGNVSINGSATIKLMCGGSNISMKSDGTIGISGKNITISGENIVSLGSTQCVMQSGSATVATQSKGNKGIVDGLDVTLSGKNSATVSGNSKATLSATGMAVIEGAVVKLN